MTRAEIKKEIEDLRIEIEAIQNQEPDAYWPEFEKARDLEGLKAKLESLTAK